MNAVNTLLLKLLYPFVIVVTIFMSIVLFLPTKALYNDVQHTLKNRSVVIDGESSSSNFAGVTVDNAALYFEDLQIARIESIEVSHWLFANAITVKNLYVGKNMSMLKGFKADKIELRYDLFSPLTIVINSKGNFGSLRGQVDLSSMTLSLLVKPSRTLLRKRFIMKLLKRSGKEYSYVHKL